MGLSYGKISLWRWKLLRVEWGFRLVVGIGCCFGTPLSQAFPKIYDLAVLKHVSVEEHVKRDLESHAWDLHLRLGVNNWEMLAVSCLIVRLDRASIGGYLEPNNKLSTLNPKSLFSVSSMYNFLCPLGMLDRSALHILKSKMRPFKDCFHLWLVVTRKVLTQDTLMKRGFQLESQC